MAVNKYGIDGHKLLKALKRTFLKTPELPHTKPKPRRPPRPNPHHNRAHKEPS